MEIASSTYNRERFLLTVLLLVLGLALTVSSGLKRWDLTLYDLFSTVFYQKPSKEVLIIAIDELSLREYGRWPWPRRVHADLINKLTRGGARAVGYDVIFSEANQADPEDDQALAQALARSGRVILPVFHEKVVGKGALQLTLPLPVLARAAAGLGHVDAELDPDGVVRRALLQSGFSGKHYPALVLAMLQLAAKKAGLTNTTDEQFLRLKKRILKRYGTNPVYVSFTGPPGHFPSISFADFLQTDYPAEAVNGKLILVGVTALGLGDSLPTPVSGKSIPMPGIEYNANLLSGLLNNTLIVPLALRWRLTAAAVLALLPMLLYSVLTPRQSLLIVVFLLFLTLTASLFLLHRAHLWFPPTAILIVLALSYPLWIWRRLEDTIIQLLKEKERAQVILNSIGDGVIATDISGRVEYMNPVAESLTGYPLLEAKGRRLEEIFPATTEDHNRNISDIIERCLKKKRTVTIQESGFLTNRKNREHVVRTSAGLLHTASGRAQGVVLGITDVTKTHKMMRQMAYQATHDMLTGLPNRTMLYKFLTGIIARADMQEDFSGIFFIDLDQFKKVNDQIGHYGADQLLKKVGKRLQSLCSGEDILAHLGSDKFVLVLDRVQNRDMAGRFAGKLFEVLEPPFSMEGQNVYISSSIGICMYPGDGQDVDELLKNGDTAMYRAKECGRNLFRFFSRTMKDRIHERLDIEQRLREALALGELEVYYQPQVRAADGRLVGAESLLRWKNSEYGLISPAKFIPVAEDCGLILPIGEWALQTVCRQIRSWQDVGLDSVRVAVNLSSKQFLYGDIFTIVRNALQETGLTPSCLELEITESLIMDDLDQATQLLKELKELGVRVSIDDFGTGYSSLSYLKHFPVDQLKIDQSFVRDIADNPSDEAITLAIITMAHGLGLGVIAEGVEHQEQLAILQRQNCDEIQGYFFSRPLSVEQMTSYLLNHSIP